MTFSIKIKSQMKDLQLLKHKPHLTELFKNYLRQYHTMKSGINITISRYVIATFY